MIFFKWYFVAGIWYLDYKLSVIFFKWYFVAGIWYLDYKLSVKTNTTYSKSKFYFFNIQQKHNLNLPTLTKELFIFSGLGADERVFQKLDFSGYTTTFIKWIAVKDKETIEDYAQRLCQQISSEKPILIGLSFGGIMATTLTEILRNYLANNYKTTL